MATKKKPTRLEFYSGVLRLGNYFGAEGSINTIYLKEMGAAFVYFEILLSTRIYGDYCFAQRRQNILLKTQIEEKYPNIEAVWYFWGDIFVLNRCQSQDDYFLVWFLTDKNYSKFYSFSFLQLQVVFEGAEVVAEPNSIIVAISKEHDMRTASRIFGRKLSKIAKLFDGAPGEFVVGLKKQLEYSEFGSMKFEQRVDVLYWRNHLGMTPFQCILTAHRFASPAWDDITYKIDKCFKASHKRSFDDLTLNDVKSVVRIFDRLKNQGETIAESLLNDKFTAPDINPF